MCPKGRFSSNKQAVAADTAPLISEIPLSLPGEVKSGIISIECAKEDYRVIVDPETFELDAEATRKLREG